MDAYGNLTSPDEFDGVTVRLISYQPSPPKAFAALAVDAVVEYVAPGPEQSDVVEWVLEQSVYLATADQQPAPNYLQFQVVRMEGGGFTLAPDGINDPTPWFKDHGLTPPAGFWLGASPNGPLIVATVAQGDQPGVDQTFHVDFLEEDCWFSLYYTTDQDYFVSVSGQTSFGQPAIAGTSWSNAPSQIWRAQVVTPATAVAAGDTPAAHARPDPRKAGRRT